MAVFQAALINELEKLRKKKKAVVAIVLSLLMTVIGQLLVLGVRMGFGIRGAGSTDFSMLVLSFAVNTLLPLFAVLVAIDSFSGEFNQNTMRTTLTRPISRFKIYAAKVTAIGIFILVNLAFLSILSLVFGLVFSGDTMSFKGVLQVILAYGVSFFPIFILALGVVLLANVLKSGTSVFFVAILSFIIFKGLGVLFSQYLHFHLFRFPNPVNHE